MSVSDDTSSIQKGTSAHVTSIDIDLIDCSGAGQEIVAVSKKELKRSKSKPTKHKGKKSPKETFNDENPTPLLIVETKASKPKNPFARMFGKKKS